MVPPPPQVQGYEKVELVWPGKTTEVERVSLPFQTIERVNEVSRSAGGQARLRDGGELPDWWPEGWRNKLIWGDNKYVLSSLLNEFAGKVDLIYIDPPFGTGTDFSFRRKIGETDVEKRPSIMEEVAFRDIWAAPAYLQFLYDRLVLLKDLLHPEHGSFFLRLDWRHGYRARAMLDQIFGEERFRNEIALKRTRTIKGEYGRFHHAFDNLYFYANGPEKFHGFRKELPEKDWKWVRMHMVGERKNKDLLTVSVHGRKFTAPPGRRWMLSQRGFDDASAQGLVRIDDESNEPLFLQKFTTIGSDWTDVPGYSKRHNYPTENSETVLERVVTSASEPGDLVLDCFIGSGTTAAVSERLGRKWIAADIGRFAVQTTRMRMLNTQNCRPFEVLNLGRYERSHWQGADVGEQIGEYYDFIVQLYGATRIQGFNHLHGIKGDRMVHVGATDAPVTADELELAISECAEGSTLALDVLGWEWEMGLNPSRKDELAHFYEVDVHLLNIPREVMDQKAVAAGDIHFFELSVVELRHEQDDRGLGVEIESFTPAVDEYMAKKVGGAIERWSDWIDYWSIDFDYDGETFVNSWQSYRTRQDPSLSLISDPHRYDAPGRKTVVVKVIDIFGNDTTRELTVEVE